MQKDSEPCKERPEILRERFAILYEGELYGALPGGKLDKLTVVMNQTILPKKDKKTYERWFKHPAEIPASNPEETLTIMLDAIVEVAEDMKNGMAARVLKLRQQADAIEEKAQVVEREVVKVKEVQHGA